MLTNRALDLVKEAGILSWALKAIPRTFVRSGRRLLNGGNAVTRHIVDTAFRSPTSAYSRAFLTLRGYQRGKKGATYTQYAAHPYNGFPIYGVN